MAALIIKSKNLGSSRNKEMVTEIDSVHEVVACLGHIRITAYEDGKRHEVLLPWELMEKIEAEVQTHREFLAEVEARRQAVKDKTING